MKIVELAAVIGRDARDVSPSEAMDYVDGKTNHLALNNFVNFILSSLLLIPIGYALAIDMTARDLQAKAKAKGLPWSAAKGFDTFTPIR